MNAIPTAEQIESAIVTPKLNIDFKTTWEKFPGQHDAQPVEFLFTPCEESDDWDCEISPSQCVGNSWNVYHYEHFVTLSNLMIGVREHIATDFANELFESFWKTRMIDEKLDEAKESLEQAESDWRETPDDSEAEAEAKTIIEAWDDLVDGLEKMFESTAHWIERLKDDWNNRHLDSENDFFQILDEHTFWDVKQQAEATKTLDELEKLDDEISDYYDFFDKSFHDVVKYLASKYDDSNHFKLWLEKFGD